MHKTKQFLLNTKEGRKTASKTFSLGVIFSLTFLFLFSFSLTSATISQWDKPLETGNITNIYENNTYINQTVELNTTQFETGEPVTIKTSWLSSFINSVVDLTDYWKSDGSSTATGNWNLSSYNLTLNSIFANLLDLTPLATTITPLTIRALASQTADLTQWKDSSGTNVLSVSSNAKPMDATSIYGRQDLMRELVQNDFTTYTLTLLSSQVSSARATVQGFGGGYEVAVQTTRLADDFARMYIDNFGTVQGSGQNTRLFNRPFTIQTKHQTVFPANFMIAGYLGTRNVTTGDLTGAGLGYRFNNATNVTLQIHNGTNLYQESFAVTSIATRRYAMILSWNGVDTIDLYMTTPRAFNAQYINVQENRPTLIGSITLPSAWGSTQACANREFSIEVMSTGTGNNGRTILEEIKYAQSYINY
jgi:hypothetical protein